jgi:uncharacterized membrane protein HdeD (DUF308 family)
VVHLEGLIAAGLGLVIVLHTGDTRDLVIRVIGAYFVVTGALGVVSDVRAYRSGDDARLLAGRHVLMIALGLLAVVDPHLTTVIAWGCIVIGIVGVLLTLAVSSLGPGRWGILFVSALSIVFGFLLFLALSTTAFFIGMAGLVLILAGVLLAVYAVRLARDGVAEENTATI